MSLYSFLTECHASWEIGDWLPVRLFKNSWRAIRYFFRGVSNIIDWVPTLYHDRNWDHVYFYIILQKKLKAMEKMFEEDDTTELSWWFKRDITICIRLCERIIKDNFMDWSIMSPALGKMIWGEADEKGLCELSFEGQDRKVIDEEHLKEEKLRTKTFRLLHQILEKRSQRWWN
jgi:hypothetical protein